MTTIFSLTIVFLFGRLRSGCGHDDDNGMVFYIASDKLAYGPNDRLNRITNCAIANLHVRRIIRHERTYPTYSR